MGLTCLGIEVVLHVTLLICLCCLFAVLRGVGSCNLYKRIMVAGLDIVVFWCWLVIIVRFGWLLVCVVCLVLSVLVVYVV